MALIELKNKELGFTEILSASWITFTLCIKSILLVTLAINLPINIASTVFLYPLAQPLQDLSQKITEFSQATQDIPAQQALELQIKFFQEYGAEILSLGSSALLLMFIFGVVSTLGIISISLLTERSIVGENLGWIQALKRSLSRWASAVGTNVLAGIIIFGGYLLLVLPAFWFYISYTFAIYAVALRNKGGFAALTYSSNLFKKQRLKVIFYTAGIFILPVLLSVISGMLIQFLPSGLPRGILYNTVGNFLYYFAVVAHTILFLNLDYQGEVQKS